MSANAVLVVGVSTWVVLSLLVTYVAVERGRNGVGIFFLCLVGSPLLGYLMAVALPARAAQPHVPRVREPFDPVFAFCYASIAFCVAGLGWVAIWGPR